jgi:hypothetical protein
MRVAPVFIALSLSVIPAAQVSASLTTDSPAEMLDEIVVHAPPPTPPAIPDGTSIGKWLGIPDGWADGISMPLPIMKQAPARIAGTLEIAGLKVKFGSGGRGRYGLPYGDYPLTNDVGSWGNRHGAIAIGHDATVYDRRLHRDREGVEIHGATNGALTTAGCIAIEQEMWGIVRRKVIAMMEAGATFLHLDPNGARISAHAEPMMILADLEPRVREREPETRHHHAAHRYAERHRHRYAHRHYRHYARV